MNTNPTPVDECERCAHRVVPGCPDCRPGGAGTATPPDPAELIRRLSSSLQDLIEHSDDPGTEALAAVWEGRQYAQTGAAYTDVRPRNFLVEAAVAAYAAAHQVPVNRVTEGDDGGVEAVRAALAAATPGEPSPPVEPLTVPHFLHTQEAVEDELRGAGHGDVADLSDIVFVATSAARRALGVCSICDGTGTYPADTEADGYPGPEDCTSCGGTGWDGGGPS